MPDTTFPADLSDLIAKRDALRMSVLSLENKDRLSYDDLRRLERLKRDLEDAQRSVAEMGA